METLIISCKTLENELSSAMAKCECTYPIKWVESGLHNVPKNLTKVLQALLNESDDYDRILLAMGYCGNSLGGLELGAATMIVPRVDDCITLMLGSFARRSELGAHGIYFMTEGWLRGERTIWHEYQYTVEKFGQETTDELFKMILANYNTLAMLDTGCFDIATIEQEVRDIAKTLKLDYDVIPATIDYIELLLTGPWDEKHFLTFPAHSTISAAELTLDT